MIDIDYYKDINSKFIRRVGIISCVDRLGAMGLDPRNITGIFWARDIKSLQAVCDAYTDLHIVTNIGLGHTINKYVAGPHKYRLADGDQDPSLELKLPPEVIHHLFAELDHFVRRANIGF